jgi:protein SCO1/2
MSIVKQQTVILAAAVAAAIGIALASITLHKESPVQQLQAELQTATLYPADFRSLAPFRLTDHNGQTFDNDRLTGRWSLLFFGFTSCPDVCPMTMQILQAVNGELSAINDSPQIIFVSVDPERDTTERLRQYVTYFHPEFTGISGAAAELQALASSLGVFYARTDNPQYPERYQIDHSASLFLFSPDGRIRALFSAPLQTQAIAHDLLTIIQHG